MIKDNQRLVSATVYGHPVTTYDDGFGPIFVARDSMSVTGIVRAKDWLDADEICQDEVYPECPCTWKELENEFNVRADHLPDNPSFQEQYGFRPNGASTKDEVKTGLYMKDLNGELLDRLTPELAKELNIKLVIEDEE
jgi:hypothetical protein